MQGAEGTIEVPANRAVFRAQARGARARLLASVPKFFRPGRFERRFEARAREARGAIRERRQQRRELIRQRRDRPRESVRERPRAAAKAFREARPAARQGPGERPRRAGAAKDGRRPQRP
jgi:hypothetical protein